MQVQINHDNHVHLGEEVSARFAAVIEDALVQFRDRITRVEVHLADVNAGKGGSDDKRCLLEARVASRQPIAVSHQADTLQLAFSGALEKLEKALGHSLGKLQTH